MKDAKAIFKAPSLAAIYAFVYQPTIQNLAFPLNLQYL